MGAWALILAALLQWTPANGGTALLEGHFSSCREAEGYSERVYDRVERGQLRWSLHMGPKDEFGLYRGPGPDGPDHTHDGPDNLLAPAYHVSDVASWRAKRQWNVPSLGLWISIAAGGGSQDDCEGYFVLVKRAS